MIPLIAQAAYRHNGVWIRSGERFQVETDVEARELVAVGFAMRADVPAIEQPAAPARAPAKGYDRRDMRPKP